MFARTTSTIARRGFRAFSAANADAPRVQNFINGEFVKSSAKEWYPIHDPATNEVIAYVPQSSPEELEAAVRSAEEAFKAWRDVPPQQRMRVFLKLQQLVRDNMEDLALQITKEQGKTLADARGDVFRGLEAIEFACGIPSLQMGEYMEGVSANMDTYTTRSPLGVTAGITPFNFPFMIGCWMVAPSLACGNTMLLKPSERVPLTAMKFAELCREAGVPAGVLNVIHGKHDTVNFLCDSPPVRTISFVGGNTAGEHIHRRGSANGKRVQSNMGAKNHGVFMPDANRESAMNALVGAAFGAAGQRCMALSVAVMVAGAGDWTEDIIAKAKTLKVGSGLDPKTDIGPLISREALLRAEKLIEDGIKAGGKLVLDGRKPTEVNAADASKGNFLGPTILEIPLETLKQNPAYTEEIFGPVLVVVKVPTLDSAIDLLNSNAFGNGCAIFTSSGAAANRFNRYVEAGQQGVNVPIPVPLPFFAFSGNKKSNVGGLHLGKAAINFYTNTKTIVTNWKYDESVEALSTSMPLYHKKN